jgi:hypothetical protein
MDAADFAELTRLCDPDDGRYALRRRDFHFLQSLTFVVGTRQGDTRYSMPGHPATGGRHG